MYGGIELTGQIPLGRGFAVQPFDAKSVDSCPSQAMSVTAQLQWTLENASAIEAFNKRIEQISSPAQRLYAWQESRHAAF